MSTIEEELTEKTEQLNRRAQAIRKQRAKLRQRQRKARAEHLHELGETLERSAGRPLRTEDAEIAAISLKVSDGKLTGEQIAGAILGLFAMINSADPAALDRFHQIERAGATFLRSERGVAGN